MLETCGWGGGGGGGGDGGDGTGFGFSDRSVLDDMSMQAAMTPRVISASAHMTVLMVL